MQTAAVVADQGGAASTAMVTPEPGTKSNPLLDIGKVARRLDVSKKTVRRLIYERGAFPNWRRVEGMIRVPEQDVLAYLRRQCVGSAQ